MRRAEALSWSGAGAHECRRVCESSLLVSGQNLETWTKESPENRVRLAPPCPLRPPTSPLLGTPELPRIRFAPPPHTHTEDVNEVRLKGTVVRQSWACTDRHPTARRPCLETSRRDRERGTGKERPTLFLHNTQLCSYAGTTNLPNSHLLHDMSKRNMCLFVSTCVLFVCAGG